MAYVKRRHHSINMSCDACVSDYASLCNEYTAVSWVGLSMTLFAIGLAHHIA